MENTKDTETMNREKKRRNQHTGTRKLEEDTKHTRTIF